MIVKDNLVPGLLVHNPTTFQWKDIPESERPANPLDEYCRHQHEIPLDILAWKWEGTGADPVAIADLGRMSWLRRRVQEMLANGHPAPNLGDSACIRQLAAEQYETLSAELKRADRALRTRRQAPRERAAFNRLRILREMVILAEIVGIGETPGPPRRKKRP